MPLTRPLASPSALYRKLERESYRAFHAESPVHKSDHFFNFCIAAHSMRDYCLEHMGLTHEADKKSFHELWNKEPVLIAVAEVANSSKHFVLRCPKTKLVRTPTTKAVRMGTAKYMNVYCRDDGEIQLKPTLRAEVRVALLDGTILPLYSFTDSVLKYWRDFLVTRGIKVRRASIKHLCRA